MNRIYTLLTAIVLTIAATAQTLNVQVGNVTYQFPASQTGDMTYDNGSTLTIMDKTFDLSDICSMTVDQSQVTDNQVRIIYDGTTATVQVAGNIAPYVTASINGAHVTIDQSNTDAVNGDEITYQLSGTSTNGSLTLNGSYKCTVSLAGVTLANPTGAAINITNSKRIQLSAKKETVNTISDGSGSQKACIYSKGQLQFQGNGTLNVAGNCKHAVKSASYITVKNITINITSAVSDGFSCEEYFQLKSGTVTISGTGDDGIQCDLGGTTSTGETQDHSDEDTGNIYIDGGTLNITATADAAKGIKADGDVKITDGILNVNQTGNIIVEDDDISYPTSVKSTGDIIITGGSITINNTAEGGKALSADGNISIDESNATTVIDITANGKGGTAETSGSSGETATSYKVYISFPTSGGGGGPGQQGGSSWTNPILYTSDGTKIATLTNTVSKSTGYSTLTFYYYDFKNADKSLTYYIQADSRSSWNSTYTPRTATFSAPTSGTDIWYSVSNSYTSSTVSSVTYRTYQLSNVTGTYGGTTDVSEDSGTSYNAAGIKADGNVTIDGGTITVRNSGEMSKSIKSKATVTINAGELTFIPSGAMKVINSDASYSSAIKTVDFVQNGGTITITASGQAGRGITATNITTNGGTLAITNSGAGVQGTNDNYTAKGLKADTSISLNAGNITISMSGTGGKGIKSAGTYTQGTTDGNGPTLTVTTTGSALGSSTSGGGGFPGGPGQQSSGGSSAKGIKVQGTIYLYGGSSEVYTSTNGAEGLESKTAIYIQGGKHYFNCYDDCINSSGKIYFNGGVTVCYGYGNDAVDSNAGTTGAITIGNGTIFTYTTAGSPEEGFDCDNNSYIQITGNGIGISAGGAQGGGSSSSTISNAKQGYAFVTSSLGYQTGRYYTLANASGTNLVTYSFQSNCTSNLSFFTAKGMTSGSSYNVKYSTSAPTDATTTWHGLYLGSTATGTSTLTTFTAK